MLKDPIVEEVRATRAEMFKQAIAHGARMRQPQIGAVIFHQTGQTSKVGVNSGRPRIQFFFHTFVEKMNRPVHETNVST